MAETELPIYDFEESLNTFIDGLDEDIDLIATTSLFLERLDDNTFRKVQFVYLLESLKLYNFLRLSDSPIPGQIPVWQESEEWLPQDLPSGTDGITWHDGSGVPSGSIGFNLGDYYLDDDSGNVYKLEEGDVWELVANIVGPAGATGSAGTNGTNGTNGSVWRDGAGVPSNSLGVNGDYYLNDSNGDVYLRSAGTYSVVANIKGATGSAGTNGTNGTNADTTWLSIYRTILESSGSHIAGKVAGTYAMGQGDPLAVSGTGTLYPIKTIYIDSADYPTANSLAAKLRLRIQLYTNDVAPTGNYTFGLYPITRPGTSGGTGLNIFTLGTVVSGSTVLFTTPAADGLLNGASSDFALPANGHYVIGVVTTATVATNSHIHASASLQMHNA